MYFHPPKEYVFQPYPSYRQRAGHPPRLVLTPEDDAAAASEGWYDEGAVPVDVTGATADPAAVLYGTPVKDIEALVSSVTTLEALEALRHLETENPIYKGGRSMVLKCFDARAAAFSAATT